MKHRKQFLRASFFLFLLACLLTGLAGTARFPARAAPQRQAVSPGDVVISEFRVRGPNGGNDEFIELYNRTVSTVDISGLEIRGTNNSGTSSNKATIPSSTILESGQYYLIINTNNSGGPYSGGVAGNLTYSSGIADDGGIALTGSGGGTIIDQVGMTNCARCYFETSALTSLGTSNQNQGYERKLGGTFDSCQDTNDNSNDFSNITPSNPQNLSSPLSLCGTVLPTLTPTDTPSPTGTPTNTSPPSMTGILISEFRTTGPGGGNDEFIELYNPTGSPISIGNWMINKSSGCGSTVTTIVPALPAVTLASGQHYLIGGSTYSGSVTPDLPNTSLNIADSGGIALLQGTTIIDQVGLCATTLYHEGTALTPLTSSSNRSYDRRANTSGICVDSDDNAADFILRNPSDPQNSSSPLTNCGNPTPTPTITRTPTRTRTPTLVPTITRTPTPLPPPPLIAINEFVPRPGHDWNNDGIVNVGDEFIELLNHGVVDVNLSGWSLDDEVNIGSRPYRLPAITLSPGERMVFYGKDTGLLLSDGGDGVRLLKPNGQLADAFNYRVVRYPDQAYCRYPDNGGADDWTQNCFPTPGLRNSLSGSFVNPSNRGEVAPLCPIADTLPIDFVLAECPPFGDKIFRPAYWDKSGWYGERYLPESSGEWPVFAD